MRASKDVSQAAVSEATGITQSQISRIFSGNRAPYLDELVAIAAYFGTTPEKILQDARAILSEQYANGNGSNVVELSDPASMVLKRAAARRGKGRKGEHHEGED